jgi:hypothetical protein
MPRRLRSTLERIAGVALVVAPLSLWVFWKTVRALVPQWSGIHCYAGDACSDDPSRASEALSLKIEAELSVERWAGRFDAKPRMIFCTTDACDRNFGLKDRAAYNVGAKALVVAIRGWQPYYTRHELIHCVQVERIGGFRMLLQTPRWLVAEGIPYSAGADPRRPLQEPWESWRVRYEEWVLSFPAEELWSRAVAL